MSLTIARTGTTGTVGLDYQTGNLPDDTDFSATRLTSKRQVVTLVGSSSTVLTAAQSGSLINVVQNTSNNTVTLPVASRGLFFDFRLTAVPNGTHTLTISGASAGLLNGNYTAPGTAAYTAATSFTAKNSLILGSNALNAKIGDWARIECIDGTNWLVQAQSTGAATGWTAP